MSGYIFSAELVDNLRAAPLNEVLRDLGTAARDVHLLNTPEFRKLLGYLTEIADGRDRREPTTAVAGTHRPQPRLRVLISDTFGEYGDLTWFRLNKLANNSKQPLTGEFPRMAASVGRLDGDDLEAIITALVADAPDKKLLRLLNQHGGKIKNAGVELFTRLAHLFRPDLYFLVPKQWGDESGCMKFIDNDLRKYIAVCRSLRSICDEVGFPEEIRAKLFDKAVQMDPIHPTLEAAINQSIGGALAWSNIPDPNEGYVAGHGKEEISMPLEWSSLAIRVRRGDMRLRSQLCRLFKNQCAISGSCPKDLLEVSYIAPYPAGDVHSVRNAILLRSDIHTLWDLNLIGVHPETLEVNINNRLTGTPYEDLVGHKLATPSTGSRLDTTAMRERWSHFLAGQKAESSKARTPARDKASLFSNTGKTTTKSTSASQVAADATEKDAEIEVLNDLEPKRTASGGIWKSPAEVSKPNSPVIEIAEDS